jgi:PucR family transcriptional regulator, purine catabolism regulatory protein
MDALSAQSLPPAITVHQVLELSDFVAAGVEVVAGRDGLFREVSWVHAGEVPDIARFLRGGELLLTAGTGIGARPAAQRRYLKRLAEAKASALVLELGRAFRAAPPALCEEADRHGLPVAVLRREVPFAGVTRSVHAWIVGRRYELVERAEHIASELNALLLAGGGVAEILHTLHEVTDKPCLLEDPAHQLLAYAGPDEDLDPAIADWSAHSRVGHRLAGTGPVHVDRDGGCAWRDVAVRGETWARLHVLGGDTLEGVDELAIERAGSAIGLALLNKRHRARMAEDARADLFAEIARRAPQDSAAFLRQARSLGADYRNRELTVVAFEAPEDDAARLTRAALACARNLRLGALGAIRDDGRGGQLLIGVGPRRERTTPLRDIAGELLRHALDDHRVIVGVSRPATIATLPRAFADAAECQRYGRLTGRSGVFAYTDLGLHLLLCKLDDERELAAFVEAQLGRLLDHDTRSRGELLRTLRVLLESDGNKARTARLLHLERRSVYYRLQRIETLLDTSLDAYQARLSLGIAIRALDMLAERPASRHAALEV